MRNGASNHEYAFNKLKTKALFVGHNPKNEAWRMLLENLEFQYTHDEYYPPTGLKPPSYLLKAEECERMVEVWQRLVLQTNFVLLVVESLLGTFIGSDNMDRLTLDNFSLNIPHLWEKEWGEVIDESDGPEKQLLIFQARSANLLEAINDHSATPERLAWLSIWTKVFSALEAALMALNRRSEYVFKIISRIAFENFLHISTVVEPLTKLYDPNNSSDKTKISKKEEEAVWHNVLDRLCAYTAWCLWNDKQLYIELLEPRKLDDVWDPNPTLRIISDPDQLRFHETIFGPLNVEKDLEELKIQRQKYEMHLKDALNRVESWLECFELKKWVEKVEKLRVNNHRKRSVSFFELFDDNKQTSVWKRLESFRKIAFAYSIYKESSLTIHGSTIDQLFSMNENELTPKFIGLNDDAMKRLALFIGSECNHVLVYLYILQQPPWQKQENVV